jgi:hypothetical protein
MWLGVLLYLFQEVSAFRVSAELASAICFPGTTQKNIFPKEFYGFK